MTSKKEDNGDHNRFKKKYNNWLSNIKLHSRRKIEYNKDENNTIIKKQKTEKNQGNEKNESAKKDNDDMFGSLFGSSSDED